MRKALSLIELIFTIVIIAIVFTVIPKIVLSLNKADSFTIRQDAMFNGISMMKMISKLPWDENNTNSSDILHVSSSANSDLNCSQTTPFIRKGGFIGGRTCEDNKSASAISNNIEQNDIGDFDGYDENTSVAQTYGLLVKVKYIDDNIAYDYPNQTATIDINKTQGNNTTNLKYVDINVTYQGKRGEKGRQLAQFNYTSANIGQIILHKRVW